MSAPPREEGFSLVELLVVTLILGVLATIAIPNYLGQREKAQEQAAQSTLVNATRAVGAYLVENDEFADADEMATALAAEQSSYTWTTDPVSTPRDISVAVEADNTSLQLATRSDAGTCLYLRFRSNGNSARHSSGPADSCDAADFPPSVLGDGW